MTKAKTEQAVTAFTVGEIRQLLEKMDALAAEFMRDTDQHPARALLTVWAASRVVNEKAERILENEFGATIDFATWQAAGSFLQKADEA